MTLLQAITLYGKAYMEGRISIELYWALVDSAVEAYKFDRN